MPTRDWTSSVLRLLEHLMRTESSGETVVNMPRPMHSGVAVRCRCRCRCVAGWFVLVVVVLVLCVGCVRVGGGVYWDCVCVSVSCYVVLCVCGGVNMCACCRHTQGRFECTHRTHNTTQYALSRHKWATQHNTTHLTTNPHQTHTLHTHTRRTHRNRRPSSLPHNTNSKGQHPHK